MADRRGILAVPWPQCLAATDSSPPRMLPSPAGAVLALVIGGAVGIGVLAAVQSTGIAAFAKAVKDTIKAEPALAVSVIAVTTLGPLVGATLLRRRE